MAKKDNNWDRFYTPDLTNVDWHNLKDDIHKVVIIPGHGPLIVRLAWHDAGTYSIKNGIGGPHAQKLHPHHDKGLQKGRNILNTLKKKYPGISLADLWSFASAVTISNSGGPIIAWRPGRADASNGSAMSHDVLPTAFENATSLRTIFHAKGFNDREIVALSGGHNLGAISICWNAVRWTANPKVFGNEYFSRLVNNHMYYSQADGLFVDKTNKTLALLPSDMALVQDGGFEPVVQEYAANQSIFYADFGIAFSKMLELGVGIGLGRPVETVL
ncbi:UNVERIFIED_CONTAM: heme peroxidase [Siphonaria sp. JEL0065]|nr:heme peroxidase [Siphonaria sp. JEL0065]KAJ3027962.1 heme peroxidase [Siphonaria sp. JEL0065]